MKKIMKLALLVCLALLACTLVFTVLNSGNDTTKETETTNGDTTKETETTNKDTAPIKMTAEYSTDDKGYGNKLFDYDFNVYLHWSDGTKKLTRNFVIENEDCYLTPENSVKTFKLKSTEYDLSAFVNIQIPQIESFPESRETFVQKYYEAMKGIGITQYTMELKTAENGNVIGANFKDSRGAYWYFLSFSNQSNDDTSPDFDNVKLETNIQYNEKELAQMELLLISKTIPENTFPAIDAFNYLVLNDGSLLTGNVKYEAGYSSLYKTYHMFAYIIQPSAYAVEDSQSN